MPTPSNATSRPRLVRAAAIAGLMTLALAVPLAPQAFADNDDHHDNGNHYGQQKHQQAAHYRGQYYRQPERYYQEPPVVYAPPPVYYGQPPGVSLNFMFPFYR